VRNWLEALAVLVEHRLGAADVEGHRHDLAADRLGVLVDIGVGHDQRLLDHGARARREETVEARSSVVEATTATRMVGTAAMTANKPTICTCRREPARPRRRACTTTQTSRPMMASSRIPVAALPQSSLTTTSWTGAIGVSRRAPGRSPLPKASAMPTAIAADQAGAGRAAVEVAAAGSSWRDLIDCCHCRASPNALLRLDFRKREWSPVHPPK
jgi:hypothetical protein